MHPCPWTDVLLRSTLVISLVMLASPARAQSRILLYDEDFRTSQRLKEGKGRVCQTRSVAGAYVVQNISQSGTCSYWVGWSAPDNVRIETAFRLLRGDVDSGIGLAFGRDGERMHVALVSPNDAPAVRLAHSQSVAGDWVSLAPRGEEWVKDAGVAQGHGALNQLAVELRNRVIRVFVNGRFVFEGTSPSSPTGGIGFHVDVPEQEVAYEYLRVINLAP